ncbi:hypothetical protein Hypma_001370 [Hypsizygus marmoreus]|uniref:Transmembrane protein n=1 Tax=Hypsizygus marmoreus TaxID=39966 RepID=A0A369K8Q9_HYPMA|nr:hypothetical protein Hypma_001370 [Hypsizygus marmoreus]
MPSSMSSINSIKCLHRSAQRKRVRFGFRPPGFFRRSKCPKIFALEVHNSHTPELHLRSVENEVEASTRWWSFVLFGVFYVFHACISASLALSRLFPMAWNSPVSSSDLPTTQGTRGSSPPPS